MEILIDASAVVAVLLHEPERDAVIAATERTVLIAPASLPWEIGNALVAGLRRKRLHLEDVETAWSSFEDIPIRLVDVSIDRAFGIAVEHGLYVYDAYVLEAAQARRLPLLTLDRRLAQAAKRIGTTLLEV